MFWMTLFLDIDLLVHLSANLVLDIGLIRFFFYSYIYLNSVISAGITSLIHHCMQINFVFRLTFSYKVRVATGMSSLSMQSNNSVIWSYMI